MRSFNPLITQLASLPTNAHPQMVSKSHLINRNSSVLKGVCQKYQDNFLSHYESPEVLRALGQLSDFTFTFMHWRRKWQPTPVFLPGESQGWRSLVGCRLWGRTESDMTEATQQQQQQQQQAEIRTETKYLFLMINHYIIPTLSIQSTRSSLP